MLSDQPVLTAESAKPVAEEISNLVDPEKKTEPTATEKTDSEEILNDKGIA
jgi:hypothetical protein